VECFPTCLTGHRAAQPIVSFNLKDFGRPPPIWAARSLRLDEATAESVWRWEHMLEHETHMVARELTGQHGRRTTLTAAS